MTTQIVSVLVLGGLATASAFGQLGRAVGSVSHAAGASVNAATSGAADVGGRGVGPMGVSGVGSVTQSAQLASRMQTVLPPGVGVESAAAGFADAGEFVTAAYAARNLGVPFGELKQKMTGKHAQSLESAVRSLRPDADREVLREGLKLAERQKERDFRLAESGGKDRTAERVNADAGLVGRISGMLPTGMTAGAAAAGFRNEGQFLATLQAAHNLDLPFSELKERVTAGMSLGEAIRSVKPSMDKASAEAHAQAALRGSEGLKKGSPGTEVQAGARADARTSVK